MTKRTGYILIVYFALQLILMLVFFSSFPTWLKVISIVTTSVFFPFGFALLVLNAEESVRKKVKYFYLSFSILMVVAGIASRKIGLFGANIELVIAVLWYCFAYAPLELKSRYLKWKPFSNSVFEILMLSAVTFVGINTLVLGVLFKSMRWPGANLLMSVGTMVCLISIFSWNYKFRKEVIRRKESEDKIREQYTLIEDSINYAKRIQSAKLPRKEDIQTWLPDSFVLFRPKDIVSGDFYYFNKTENSILIAAADCTGHGVPGALMSMISSEKLDDAIRHTTNLSEILSHVNKGIKASLRQTDSFDSTRDGMDVALCSLDSATRTLHYAGANRPLWIVRKGQNVIEEIKPTKRSIGGLTEDEQKFDTHILPLQIGDAFYVFSDGYADTFSEEDKKLTTTRFKEMLLQMQEKSMKEQGVFLDNFIKNWMGKMEQTDDILVVGVRL